MCDDISEAENQHWLEQHIPLNRRTFGLAGAGMAAMTLFPGYAASADVKGGTRSRTVSIATPDGTADALFITPEENRHPAIILWPDIAGPRDAYRLMGTRLAEAGYAVLIVNQYYRSAPAPVLSSFAQWRTPAGQEKLKPMIAAITPAGTISDAGAFIDWLDKQAEVDTTRKIGSSGYCMGGPFTFRTALARPRRVGAIASFHGASLVNDTPDSPHLIIPKTNAAMLLAIAQNDDARQPDAKDILKQAADRAKRPAEIEVYPAQHGWCTLDSPVYDAAQAEKAWGRMLDLFSRYL